MVGFGHALDVKLKGDCISAWHHTHIWTGCRLLNHQAKRVLGISVTLSMRSFSISADFVLAALLTRSTSRPSRVLANIATVSLAFDHLFNGCEGSLIDYVSIASHEVRLFFGQISDLRALLFVKSLILLMH